MPFTSRRLVKLLIVPILDEANDSVYTLVEMTVNKLPEERCRPGGSVRLVDDGVEDGVLRTGSTARA